MHTNVYEDEQPLATCGAIVTYGLGVLAVIAAALLFGWIGSMVGYG